MENVEKNIVSRFAENPHVEIKKKLSVQGLVVSLIAVLVFVLSSVVSDPQSSLKLFLVVVGVVLIIYGIIKLIIGNNVAICRESGAELKKHEIHFENSDVSRLKQMVENGDLKSIDSLPRVTGNKAGSKLTIYINDTRRIATVQVSEFVPFYYNPIISPIRYEGESVEILTALVAKG